MATATAKAVQLLNLAYFGRPADPASLTAWQAAGMTQNEVVEVFVKSSEYISGTVNVTSTESGGVRTYNMTSLINKLYNRLVGRDAAASEITGWSNAVSSGAVNHDYLGITLVNAILNLDESVEMRQVMMAKLDSANLYSDYLATDAADLSAYSTTAGLASGRAFNDSVTTTTAKTYAEVVAVADLLDNPAKYTLTATSASASEGDSLTIAVTLDSAPTEAVTVNYVTANGSTSSADFTAASGTVTFAAGQTTQYVSIATTEDTTFEEDETFTVTFSGTRLNASVQAVGTITNDDSNPSTSAQTFTLTTGSNTFTGLDGDDTFDASTSNSLSTFDTLVGGGGTDTLNATISAAANLAVNTSAIEQINITSSGGSSLNMEKALNVSGLTSVNTTGNLTLDNIQSAITAVTIQNGVATTTTLDYDASALTGSTDDLQINLDDAVNSTIVLTRDAATTNTLETVSLNSISEANTVADLQTTAVGTTKLEVTGDQTTTITAALDTEIVTVSGGTATGAISLTTGATEAVSITTGSGADTLTSGAGADTYVTGAGADSITSAAGADTITSGDGADIIDAGAGNDSVVSGAGADTVTAGAGNDSINSGADNDTISFAATGLDSDDTVDGGAGTDTISYSADETVGDADFTNVSNVENLAAGADIDVDYTLSSLAAAAGVSQITFSGDAAADTDTVSVDADFTNNLTVVLDDDTAVAAGSVVATNYTKSLTVSANDSDLDTRVSTITGGTGSDTLQITGTTGAITVDATDLGSVTNVETIQLLGSKALGLTLANGNAADGVTLTVDATAITGIATISAAADLDGKIVINSGTAADVITGSASDNGDSINSGAGNDTIKFGSGDLTATDTVDGGAGTDILSFTEDLAHAVVDEDFTLVSNVETLTTDTNKLMAVTIGTEAAAAGINTVTFADTGGNDSLTVSSTFTTNLTVNLDSDDTNANSVVATDYTGVLTINADDTELNAGDNAANTITGGTGSDTLKITVAGNALIAEDFDSITKVETFEIVGTTAAATITIADQNAVGTAASTETLTIDASSLTTGVATISAAAEDDAAIVIKTGGAADLITASASANYGDTITSGAGNDTIYFGNTDLTAADSVDGGAGTNILQFTEDLADAIADADFTLLSNIQTVTTTADKLMSITLGSEAAGAGVATVNMKDTGGNDVLTVGAGFTNSLTVDLDSDDTHANKIDASAYTGSLTVTVADTELNAGDNAANTITGGTGSDTLKITVSGEAIIAEDLDSITKVETFQVVGTTAAATITLADENAGYTHASDYDTLTVDASSLTTGVATINAAAETNGKIIITTGGAADEITVSNSVNFGDSISSAAGADTIKIDNGDLTSIDTIDGGAGTDILNTTGDTTLLDAAFTNVSNVETLTSTANKLLVVTLGAEAAGAGITTVNLADTGGNDVVTVEAGFTNALTVDLDSDNSNANKVDASSYTGTLTVTVADTELNAGDNAANTITGGTGSDTLKITVSGEALIAEDFDSITKVETFEIVGTTAAATITIADENAVGTATSTETLTIDASSLTTGVATINASAENDAAIVIKTGGAADVITGAATTAYGDTITSGAGADTITGGAGADSITGGAGADVFTYTAVSQSNSTATDVITDFTSGTDKMNVTLDYSAITAATTVNATVVTTAAGITAVQNSLSAERGQVIYDSTNSKQYINVNNDNLITSLDYQFSTTAAAAEGDINFTITTGTNADTITAGGGADTITGGAGADVIVGGDGADTFIRNGNGTTDGFDLLTFVVADDIIDFTTNGALNTGSAVTGYAEGAKTDAVAATTGFLVLSDDITVADITTGPTEAEIETYLGAMDIFEDGSTNDSIYLAADNGAHTFIFKIIEGADGGGDDKHFDASADTAYNIARLTGITDATTLGAANFADFAAA